MGHRTHFQTLLLLCYCRFISGGETLQGCPKDDFLNDCIKNNLNKIIPSLANGWEDVGLMKLDPLKVPGLQTSEDEEDFSVNLALKETAFYGLSSSTVNTVRSENIELGKMEMTTNTPRLRCLGQYRVDGVAATFPLNSAGGFNITLSDLTVVWIVYFNKYEEEGKKHITVERLTLDAMPSQIYVSVSDEFDGDNKLGKAFNMYLNQNSFEIYYLMKPGLMKAFEELFKDIINIILLQVPEGYLFTNKLN